MKISLLNSTTSANQGPVTLGMPFRGLTRAALLSALLLPAAMTSQLALADEYTDGEKKAQSEQRSEMEQQAETQSWAMQRTNKGDAQSEDMDRIADYTSDQYQESKRSAEEYWAEFEQDSEQTWESSKEAFRDGWVEGKLETALLLNEEVNPFELDVEVDDATATLTGSVDSEMDKELARNIALGIEGIDKVDNKLTVTKGEPKQVTSKSDAGNYSGSEDAASESRMAANAEDTESQRGFGQYIADLTTTAAIKTDLLAEDQVSGMDINVETYNDIVILSGFVETEQQVELAERIAASNSDVERVLNRLEIISEAS